MMARRRVTLALALVAAALVAATAGALPVIPRFGTVPMVVAPQAPWPNPYPPGTIPPHGALVHLRAGVCGQTTTLTVRTTGSGGKGLVVVSDGVPHWLSSNQPPPASATQVYPGPLLAGHWVKVSFLRPGSYSYWFASADCQMQVVDPPPAGVTTPAPFALYDGRATTIRVTAT